MVAFVIVFCCFFDLVWFFVECGCVCVSCFFLFLTFSYMCRQLNVFIWLDSFWYSFLFFYTDIYIEPIMCFSIDFHLCVFAYICFKYSEFFHLLNKVCEWKFTNKIIWTSIFWSHFNKCTEIKLLGFPLVCTPVQMCSIGRHENVHCFCNNDEWSRKKKFLSSLGFEAFFLIFE